MAATAGAQEDGTGGSTGLLARVAEKLGIDVETVRGAFKDARLDAVDEALAEGRITEGQAATARERIEHGESPRRLARLHAMHRARHAIVESAASALGMTGDELRAELKDGNSIADVAEERGIGLDEVKSRIISDAETKLAQLVEEGRIKQARMDAMLARLNERIDDIMERARHVDQ
jgi:hypothetical protein